MLSRNTLVETGEHSRFFDDLQLDVTLSSRCITLCESLGKHFFQVVEPLSG